GTLPNVKSGSAWRGRMRRKLQETATRQLARSTAHLERATGPSEVASQYLIERLIALDSDQSVCGRGQRLPRLPSCLGLLTGVRRTQQAAAGFVSCEGFPRIQGCNVRGCEIG